MAGARGPGRRGFAMQQGGDGDAARPSPVGDLGTDAPPGRHGPPPATSPVQGGSHGGPMPAGAAPQPPAAASGGPAGGQGAGSFWGDYGKGFNSSGPAAHPPAAQAPKASGPATASGEARRDGTAAQAALPTRSLQASLSSKHLLPLASLASAAASAAKRALPARWKTVLAYQRGCRATHTVGSSPGQ